jgi:histidyl-tRNA synthetase
MYTFEDRAGESLTLRPEATASLLRAYIEHGLYVEPKPVKLYTMGPMFRYERPQAGRYRQFHQLDVEALGEEHPRLDAELMGMLVDFFAALGLASRLRLEVNSIGDRACRPAYHERLRAYLRQHAGSLCEECRERLERNPLRVLDCKRPECRPVLDGAPVILDSLCEACAEHFRRVRRYLDALGVTYAVNPRLVRGLDYYIRTTFEMTTTDLGAQNAVAGGGRYDGLIAQLGGPAEAGNGFAIGMERVVLLLGDADGEAPPLATLIPLGEEALAGLLPVARDVRASGVRLEMASGERKLRSELERANKLGTAYAVIVGSAELERGEAVVREMKSGEQRRVPLASLADELRALGRRA